MKGENKMIKQKELNMIQRGFVPILENSSCDPRILETLSIIHNYDSELLIHCINTEKYVRKTLDHLGKTDEELCMAALIHDIGKIYVSYEYLKDRGFSLQVCEYVLYHHGVKDEWKDRVPQESKKASQNIGVLRAGDIFDALTSNRPYRKAMKKDDAIEILKEEHIEPRIITCVRKTI